MDHVQTVCRIYLDVASQIVSVYYANMIRKYNGFCLCISIYQKQTKREVTISGKVVFLHVEGDNI